MFDFNEIFLDPLHLSNRITSKCLKLFLQREIFSKVIGTCNRYFQSKKHLIWKITYIH